MRNYILRFSLNVAVLGIFIFISIFNVVVTVADGSAADGLCDQVDCGNGKCVEGGGFLGLGFDCVCDPGWKKMQVGPVTFPSCNLPNCTLDLGCRSQAPTPPPSPPNSLFNISDPCSLVWCGNGKCQANGTGHYCQCNEGATHYMNMSSLPCLDECVFGSDCKGVALSPLPSLPFLPSHGHGVMHGPHQRPQFSISSLNDGPCEHVDCAKGKCVENGEFLGLGFDCVCDPGWKQLQLGSITFPPCNIPNCTVDFGCGGKAPLPPPSAVAPFNISNPCSLVWCNNGKCEVNGTKHHCQCDEGSENLMDVPELPCFDQCVFGADCTGLVLGGDQPSPPNPTPPPPKDGVEHGPNQSPQSSSPKGSNDAPKDPNCSRSLRAFSVLVLITIFPVLV